MRFSLRFVILISLGIFLGIFLLHSFFCCEKSQEESEKEKYEFIPTCVSPENKAVDWFIIYMFTKDKKSKRISYAYIDHDLNDFKIYTINNYSSSDSANNEAIFPPIRITLGFNSSKANYIIWNDDSRNAKDPAPEYNTNYAHSKGILTYSDTSSVFITHSLPKFPLRKDKVIQNKLPGNAGYFASKSG